MKPKFNVLINSRMGINEKLRLTQINHYLFAVFNGSISQNISKAKNVRSDDVRSAILVCKNLVLKLSIWVQNHIKFMEKIRFIFRQEKYSIKLWEFEH